MLMNRLIFSTSDLSFARLATCSVALVALSSLLIASDKKSESFELRVTANGTSGSTSSFHLNGELDWERREKASVWDADVSARFQNGSGGAFSNRNYGARLGNRFDLNSHGMYGFGEAYGEVDDKRNVRMRGDVIGGVGRYFIETHDTQFRAQVGLGYVWLNQSNPTDTDNYVGAYAGWSLNRSLSREWNLEHNMRFVSNINGFRDVFFVTDLKLRARINDKTSAYFSIEQHYDSLINDTPSRNRFTYSTGISYKF